MPLERFEVEPAQAGERVDKFLARKLGISRSTMQRLIEEGLVRAGSNSIVSSYRLSAGERVEVEVREPEGVQPEDIPVPVVFEDEYLLVADKPAGLIVHPGAGNPSGTLVNALLSMGITGGEDPDRPGVVHRLDRDTSGLIVLAKSQDAYAGLVQMIQAHDFERIYRTITVGNGLPDSGTIDSPVGRDPDHPVKMTAGIGKPAVTHFQVMHRAAGYTMLRVKLETGRTHQIRVHLSAIGYPVYADPLYGKAVPDRIWLHAERLSFEHPVTGEKLKFISPVPEELRKSARRLDAGFPF